MKYYLALFVYLAVLGVCFPAQAQDDVVVYFSNGASLSIPAESWDVKGVPKGFNTAAYGPGNPNGQLPGWGGWPEYDDGCPDESKLTTGGYVQCDRKPYWITAPDPEPVVCDTRELTVGGAPCVPSP